MSQVAADGVYSPTGGYLEKKRGQPERALEEVFERFQRFQHSEPSPIETSVDD